MLRLLQAVQSLLHLLLLPCWLWLHQQRSCCHQLHLLLLLLLLPNLIQHQVQPSLLQCQDLVQRMLLPQAGQHPLLLRQVPPLLSLLLQLPALLPQLPHALPWKVTLELACLDLCPYLQLLETSSAPQTLLLAHTRSSCWPLCLT
jgi:hypothetical protein